MKAVGVKSLKNNLSRYLKEVRAGERILVTDREEVIAEIHRPVLEIAGKVSRWEAFLNAEELRGRLRRPRRTDVVMREFPPLREPLEAEHLIDEVRQDRR